MMHVFDFVEKYKKFVGSQTIDGIDKRLRNSRGSGIRSYRPKFLLAVKKPDIYRHIEQAKGKRQFYCRSLDGRNWTSRRVLLRRSLFRRHCR